MNNTVEFALRSMCFLPYTHIVVRSKTERGLAPLGGGFLSEVISRYGKYELVRSLISDNILFVDVANYPLN